MHPRNPYADKKPDFAQLAQKYPGFAPFVKTTDDGFSNIDWKDGDALRALTWALLKEDWQLDVEIRPDRLCPTVPNRLDYIYHILDLRDHLETTDEGRRSGSTAARPLRVMDIGTGALAIYPLLIHRIDPDAQIIATEKDNTSLEHARKTLERNNVPPEAISLRKSPGEEILFPLLDDKQCRVDMMMCNPPFFASAEEMQAGQAMKADAAHTAHTGADNEMVTTGGEVAFVGQMIRESRVIGARCTWYTSLIGRYSSLPRLITKLRETRVDNYYILSIRPAKTVRWILIWSFTAIRLPDSLTRPDPSITGGETSFTRLLPLHNTVRHVVRPARPAADTKSAMLSFLERIRLSPMQAQEGGMEMRLEARGNTWSRAARRKLAQHGSQPGVATGPGDVTLRATLRIQDGSVEMDWTFGNDRNEFDSLWKSLLANSGLVDRSAAAPASASGSSVKRKAEDQGSRGDGQS